MTKDIDELWSVTTRMGGRTGQTFVAFAQVFSQATHKGVGDEIEGFGRTQATAADAAIANAKRFTLSLRDSTGGSQCAPARSTDEEILVGIPVNDLDD